MGRYAALLRGMNVGGHRITNDELRQRFEEVGLTEVAIVLASGNVVFTAADHPADDVLEARIERHLGERLGYAVPTFVRSQEELAAISTHVPFPGDGPGPGQSMQVLFLRAELPAAARRSLVALATDHDSFAVAGREIYWLCRGRQMEATYDQKAFTKLVGKDLTARTQATTAKLLAKF